MSIKSDPRSRRRQRQRWELKVFVVDTEPRSAATLARLIRLCEAYVPGRYRIRTVDLRTNPECCRKEQIVAVPTIVRRLPLPERRVIGTLVDAGAAAAALELAADERR